MSKKPQQFRKRTIQLNVLVLLLPVLCGVAVIVLLVTGRYQQNVTQTGSNRLETDGWQAAQKAFKVAQPDYGRKYAYYKVKEKQDLAAVANHFSVPVDKLAELNPGTIVAGATLKITPLEAAMKPIDATSGTLSQTRITTDPDGTVHVKQDFKNAKVITNLPELATFLESYGVLQKTGPKSYRMLKSLSLEDNMRIDITSKDVEKLELASAANNGLCLCVENAELLIKGVKVTSYDPAIKGPDTNQNDERSFLRALKSARMDIIDSDISFLGNGLDTSNAPIQREGGTYGISWRIPDDMLGVEIVTGWVQGTDFHNNHFGSYTYGASGMVWDGNRFYNNDVYGLDPHDDSNNALIQNNVFDHNGKHGFIVSKRCNYNIIRNNVSHDNALHGYMLHQDSAYNVFDNNIAYNNTDNFAIYASDFNMVKNNKSYNPRGSHVRVNAQSNNTFITGNTFAGGGNGVYAYGNTVNTYVADNTFQSTKNIVLTNGAKNVFIGNNTLDRLGYKVKNGDRIIFGPNTIASNSLSLPDGVNLKILLASKITQPTNETNE